MKIFAGAVALAITALFPVSAAWSQSENSQASAQTVVTVLPKNGDNAPSLPASSLEVKVDGKTVQPLTWHAYGQGQVELVLLIDNSLRTSFGRNLEDLGKFVQGLPPNISIGIAYMQNGAAVFAAPLSTNHADATKGIRLPSGTPGSNASPYFCLQDLAKRWPAPPSGARREVIMITDGVDPYAGRYDPDNPYIQGALDATNRAGLVVYSIYYRDQGRLSGSYYATNAGQNYLTQVADATGGNLYYEGLSNPVSFTPFLSDVTRRLENQYELAVPVKAEKKASFADLKLKTDVGSVKLRAASRVTVAPEGAGMAR